MKKLLFVAIILIVFLGILVIAVHKTGTIAISQKISISNSGAGTAAYGNNSFVFSDGNNLQAYNYTTGTATALSGGNTGLGTIDTVSVSSDSSYIVFDTQNLTASGNLANELGDSSQPNSWWVFSVKSNHFQELDSNVVLAKVVGNTVYTLAPSNGNEVLTSYSASSLTKIKSVSISGAVNFLPTSGGYLLQSGKGQILYTTDGIVNKVVLNSGLLVGYNQTSSTALLVNSNSSDHSLVSVNLSTYKSKTIATQVYGQPAWLGPGYVLYSAGSPTSTKPNIYEYNLSSNANKEWRLDKSIDSFGLPGASINTLVGPSTAIVSNSSSNYYILGNNLATPHTVI